MMGKPRRPGYVVLRRVGEDLWQLIGDADRRPGLSAKASRAQAIEDATGGSAVSGEDYRVLPRSEWDLAGR